MGKISDRNDRRTPKAGAIAPHAVPTKRRIDRLAHVVDCCTEARQIAEGSGETFLAYLLAMAIQETRSAMRSEVETRREVVAVVRNLPPAPDPLRLSTTPKQD